MKKYCIEMEKYSINYYLSSDTCELFDKLVALETDCYYVVYDLNIGIDYIAHLQQLARSGSKWKFIDLDTSETNKTMNQINILLEKLMLDGITRDSYLIALGGGIVGNIVGLCANLLFRGIKFIHMPTTFLAATDSVLSIKQAVNSSLGKNTYGTYYKPEMILMDFNSLKSLPKRDYNSGIAELVKNFLTIIPDDINDACSILNTDVKYSYSDFMYLLEMSIKAKSIFLKNDMYEKKDGLIFEYGHTVGHAIEFLTKGAIKHGEAVAFGMLVAGEISFSCGILSGDDLKVHYSLIQEIDALCYIKELLVFDNKQLLELLQYDNKRGYINCGHDEYPFILLKSLGIANKVNDKILTLVSLDIVKKGINNTLKKISNKLI